MRQPPTAFQKMRYRRAQIAEQLKRRELSRLAFQAAANQIAANQRRTGDIDTGVRLREDCDA